MPLSCPVCKNIMPAVCGGLFFALTTGAGISLLTFLTIIVWQRYLRQYWVLLFLFLASGFFFTIKFHYNVPVILVCVLIVCAVIFAAHLLFRPRTSQSGVSVIRLFAGYLAVIVIIALIWMPVVKKDMFLSIRDNLLLTNPVGRTINDFYYQYTLYPAEMFKSLDQKLLKSCHIHIDDLHLRQQISKKMIRLDYLPIDKKSVADLSVKNENGTLLFLRHGKTIYQCSPDKFLNDSEKILELISRKTDINSFLRKITFYSLIAASPLVCYIFLHTLFMLILFFIKSKPVRFVSASAACLLIFTLPAISFYRQPAGTMDDAEIGRLLRSDLWQNRVAALKTVSDQNHRIERYINPVTLAQNDSTVERYWLANTLGNSRLPESYHLILQLLDDRQPNVVCMAFYSLGRQNRLNAADEIIRRIKSSKHWYVQWYAYKALKRLGWTQAKLKK